MKELIKTDTSIEVKANKDQERKERYVASIDIKPGHKLWAYNMATGELNTLDVADEKNYHYDHSNFGGKKKLMLDEDCIYVSALNKTNAARKVLLQFGWKWDKKNKKPIGLFDTVKGEDQIVELNMPKEKQSKDASIIQMQMPGTEENPEIIIKQDVEFPTAENKDSEIYRNTIHKNGENEGAYADDDKD